MNRKLVLVGNPNEVHVGAHLHRAAQVMELRTAFCDTTQAFEGTAWQNRFNWWLRGRRPTRLCEFSEHVVRTCRELRPVWMLATGIAPINTAALRAIGELGVKRLNFLTDDPWNPARRAPWFMEALPLYDQVFSPRRSIFDDLRQAGCPRVAYLPFAYAPNIHFQEETTVNGGANGLAADVVFAGGADDDRVPYMATLMREGFKVALYGGYWKRYRETASAARGHADAPTLRKAVRAAKVALCLVRRANRDGHCMRSFEVPAIGACMLTEDTPEHREIFGEDGHAVVYFSTPEQMVEKLRWLLDHDEERRRLAEAAYRLITAGKNTYHDRLESMLQRNCE